jgi:beta-galactosidase
MAITRRRSITGNWRWYLDREPGSEIVTRGSVIYSASVVAWGRGLTTRAPDKGLYVKEVTLSRAADTWMLMFDGSQALVRVWVNDHFCGVLNPRDPFVNLTDHVGSGETATISLYVERWHGEAAGEVTLLEGRRATNWSVSGGGEQALWSFATQAARHATARSLPYRLAAGGVAWLFGGLGHLVATGESWTLHCTGRNAKVTAFLNGRGVGRIWLPSAGRPPMRGGNNDALYLPAPWFQQTENLMAFLVEAVEHDEDAEIVEVVARRRPSIVIDSSR